MKHRKAADKPAPQPPTLSTAQIAEFVAYCLGIEEKGNEGTYSALPWFDDRKLKPIRDGIVFYSGGWGWRLRVGWRNVWASRFDWQALPPINPGYLDNTPAMGSIKKKAHDIRMIVPTCAADLKDVCDHMVRGVIPPNGARNCTVWPKYTLLDLFAKSLYWNTETFKFDRQAIAAAAIILDSMKPGAAK